MSLNSSSILESPSLGSGLLLNKGTLILLLAGTAALLVGLDKLLTPNVSSSEPWLLKPSIPLVGHIINLFRYENDFHHKLYQQTGRPALTLQMLWGKLYVILDHRLGSAAMRASEASFDEFGKDFGSHILALPSDTMHRVNEDPAWFGTYNRVTSEGLAPSRLREVTSDAADALARVVCEIDEGSPLTVPNLYHWARELITSATLEAMMGPHGIVTSKDRSVNDDIWAFEGGVASFVTHPFPRLTNRKAWKGRAKVIDAMEKYYDGAFDKTESRGLVKARSALSRATFTTAEIPRVETGSIFPMVTNSGPMGFWFVYFTYSNPDILARVRTELEAATVLTRSDDGTTTASFNLSGVEDSCPLTSACFKEAVRLANNGVQNRRMIADATLRDGDGRTYLFKKGTDLQISTGIGHRSREIWGDDALEFRPDRFLRPLTRDQKSAYQVWGGGAHLCPGRHFVLQEVVSMAAVLVVGFDVELTGPLRWEDVKMAQGTMGSNSCKPMNDAEGLQVRVSRRAGWDKTSWAFKA
ncbi:hypothetical protein PspLS_05122 [Pyricularia sp. CBS 133598]|nr:hypothetical protein PspLS_05122 [Pyricularia sp. CBS 133598]